MKISMVCDHADPLDRSGGTRSRQVAELSAGLARHEHEVTVYTRRDARSLPDEAIANAGYRVVYVPAGPAAPLPEDELLPLMGPFARYLHTRWSADRPTVVHAHFWMSGLATQLAARRLGCPTVQTFHTLGVLERRHDNAASPPDRIRIEELLARGAGRIIAPCTDEVIDIARMGPRRTHVSVVPYGVDPDLFSPNGYAARKGARRRIVTGGRLVPHKGFDVAISALTDLPDVELVIAGGPRDGTLRTDPEARRLRTLADTLGVSDRVALCGNLARERMPTLLRSADAVVCTPWYEPFGIVALEAMACGVPVVAAAVGGLLDTVVHGVTGVLVPPRDPVALAAELRRLFSDEPTRAALGAAGRERASARYSWDRIAADTARAYQRLTAAPAEPAALEPGSRAGTTPV